MKIWGIEDKRKAEVEDILANTPAEYIGLCLANLGACSEEAFQEQNEAWMNAHFPELRFR